VDQIIEAMRFIGLPPAQAGTGILLAVLLRYARGMFHAVTSEWTYVLAVAFGVVGGLLDSNGTDWRPIVREVLVLSAFVLILQKVLETAAKTIPWLPQDNEWTKVNPTGGTK
jgi:hypothetical protein